MKRFLFSIFMASMMLTVDAQTIHWLVFADTNDYDIGEGCEGDKSAFINHFANEINAALSTKGYNSRISDNYGANCTPEKCKEIVNTLQVKSDDIVVFYYSGHGARELSDAAYANEHPFPQMCLSSNQDERLVPQEWVYNTLKSKGARLTVVITDCCNVMDPAVSRKSICPTTSNKGTSKVSQKKMQNIQKLFLGFQGGVNATSSKPGQSSYAGANISLYTGKLCAVYDDLDTKNTSDVNWDDFLSKISSLVSAESRNPAKYDEPQDPLHHSSLSPYSMPSDRPVTPPSVTQPDDWQNELSNNLSALCSTMNTQASRIGLERSLNGRFAPGAVVKMLAQDSDLVIDKESAEDFLGRLSTSTLLLSIAVADGEKDFSGKIKELKVREVYRN